jgi:hypothetical protein
MFRIFWLPQEQGVLFFRGRCIHNCIFITKFKIYFNFRAEYYNLSLSHFIAFIGIYFSCNVYEARCLSFQMEFFMTPQFFKNSNFLPARVVEILLDFSKRNVATLACTFRQTPAWMLSKNAAHWTLNIRFKRNKENNIYRSGHTYYGDVTYVRSLTLCSIFHSIFQYN